MTSNMLTHYAEMRLETIRREIDRLTNAIGYSCMLGASPEHIQRLQQSRRVYQLILIQAMKGR